MSPKQIIFRLETKVESAIDLIQQLKQRISQISLEKDQIQKKFQEYEETIQGQLDEYEERVLELEKLVDSAQKEQSNLEKSVVNAISVFETVEELKNGIDTTSTTSTVNSSIETADNNSESITKTEEYNDNTSSSTHEIQTGDGSDDIFINDEATDTSYSSTDNTTLDIDIEDNEDNVFQNDTSDINIDEIDFSSDFDPTSDNSDSKENENSRLEIL